MSDYNDIVDANGEIIHVSADDSADGVRLVQDGQQLIVVDEDAIAQFTTRTGSTLTDLGTARSVLTHGDMNAIAGLPFIGDSVFAQIDAQNLKLGAFPEAQALAEAYRENFYKSSADQVERIYHGIGDRQDRRWRDHNRVSGLRRERFGRHVRPRRRVHHRGRWPDRSGPGRHGHPRSR